MGKWSGIANDDGSLRDSTLVTQISRRQAVTGVWALPAQAIMQSPLVTCRTHMTVREAFDLLRQRHIGSLGVVDEKGQLLGMLTFATLAEALIVKGIRPLTTVLDAMSTAPCSIDSETPLWKIQSEQSRLRVKYLVVQEQGKPVGVISQTDILQTLLSYQRSVITQIDDAADFTDLKTFADGLGRIAQELREHNRSASQTVRALSEVHLAIQRRCIELVLSEMNAQGKSGAPLAYALIIMGSGGRKEMLLGADQDNGIILADSPDDPAQAWFMDFCDRINRRLDEVGYAWCTGNIMARNPDFHKSLAQWKEHISRITEMPTEKAARWSAIFFDFEILYGSARLCKALRSHLHQQLREKPRLLTLMVEDDASGGPALGLFNRLVTANDKTRKGRFDLKRNGSRLLADAARIYALSENIDVNNTGDRLRTLARLGRLDPTFIQSVLAAYDEILDLTLAHQLRQLKNGVAPDKLVAPDELTPLDKQSLRIAMQIIKRFQGRLQGEFGTIML